MHKDKGKMAAEERLVAIILLVCAVGHSSAFVDTYPEGFEECFCQLAGQIDDCTCDVDTVDYFNNKKIFPRLQSLLHKPYFRFFQYNDHKACPFWDAASGKCVNPNCGVKSCPEDELPPGLKGAKLDASNVAANHNKWTVDQGHSLPEDEDAEFCSDDSVDNTISEESRLDLDLWAAHDRSESSFCDLDDGGLDGDCEECIFVDLTLNPERYTGYSGEAAHRIWRAIYEENCFKPPGGKSFREAFLQVTLGKLSY